MDSDHNKNSYFWPDEDLWSKHCLIKILWVSAQATLFPILQDNQAALHLRGVCITSPFTHFSIYAWSFSLMPTDDYGFVF